MSSPSQQLNHGWQLQQAKRFAEAEGIYRQVLQVEPRNANAWCYLGMVCHDQDRLEEAVAAYRRAIEIQPSFPIAFNNLGNSLRLLRRLDEAIACFDHALKQKPDYINAHKNKGTALVWEGHLDAALASYHQALELAPDDAETHKNLGVIWLLQGKFAEGWREYAWRWKTSEVSLPKFSQPEWDGSPLGGKTILLCAEQGLGDTILFIRYGAVLKRKYDCRVIAMCQRPLLKLLSRTDGVDQWVAQGDSPPPFDLFAPLLNVPGILQETAETVPREVPYVFPDPALVEKWRRYLADFRGLKVGLAWQGNPDHAADRMRSFSYSEFAPLGQLRGIQFFSLQRGRGSEQIEESQGLLEIVEFDADFDRSAGAFMDTAAVMKNLDLVITCDSAVSHVAGALGVPCWLALPHVPDWRWLLERPDSPWYPTARLFRQPKPGDWSAVFAQIAAELPTCFPDCSPPIQLKSPAEYRQAASGFNRVVRARHGLMLTNRHDELVGRSIDLYGEYSAGEAELFQQLVRPGHVAVEVGANIGAHTLLLSRRVGERGMVYAFEPQRVLFQMLCANLALNSRTNAVCRCEALGDRPGEIIVPPIDYSRDNDFAALRLGQFSTGERVPLVTLDSLNLPRCDFLKVDVEGEELAVIRGAVQTIVRCRPVLYMDADSPGRSPGELIEQLLSLGYRLYWYVTRLFNPANYFHNSANEFGQLVTANVLGVHSSVSANIQGLRPIAGPDSDWRPPA